MLTELCFWNTTPFPIGTSVHKDVTDRLREIDPGLCREVGLVLEQNKLERHVRGGEATKQKYIRLRQRGETDTGAVLRTL